MRVKEELVNRKLLTLSCRRTSGSIIEYRVNELTSRRSVGHSLHANV